MRSCWYAYTEQIKKKGDFGSKEGIFRKKNSNGMGLEARDFSEKFFFGNFKILRDLSCASHRLPLGGGTPPYTPKTKKMP